MHGSYEALNGGTFSEAFGMLTGMPVQTIRLGQYRQPPPAPEGATPDVKASHEKALERWKANNASRIEAGRSAHPIDSRVLDAVARHPRAGGVALGFDRLLLVLLGLSDIRETQISG